MARRLYTRRMSDDFDEVAYTALIASGVDPATAYEACRADDEPSTGYKMPRVIGWAVLMLVGLFALTVAIIALVG